MKSLSKLSSLKQELIKLTISFIFVYLYLLYFHSGFLRNSLLDSFKVVTFGPFDSYIYFGVFLIYIIIGYVIFNLVYGLLKLILIKSSTKHNFMKLTTAIIAVFMCLWIMNDQLIINEFKNYKGSFERNYDIIGNSDTTIDSTNYMNYQWIREGSDFHTEEFLIKEKITFDENKIQIHASRMIADRFYFFRVLFNDIIEYELEGIHYYKNSNYERKSTDSVEYYFQIELWDNKLYYHSNDIH